MRKFWKIIGEYTHEDKLHLISRGAKIVALKLYEKGEGEQKLQKMKPWYEKETSYWKRAAIKMIVFIKIREWEK